MKTNYYLDHRDQSMKETKTFVSKIALLFCFIMVSFAGIAQTTKNVAIAVTEQGATEYAVGAAVKVYDANYMYSVNNPVVSPSSPLLLENVPVGTYTYEITKSCFTKLMGTFTVEETSGSTINLSYTLVPSGITTANMYFFFNVPMFTQNFPNGGQVLATIKDGSTVVAEKVLTKRPWWDFTAAEDATIYGVPFGTYSVTLHCINVCRADVTHNNIVVGCSTLDPYNETPTVGFTNNLGTLQTTTNVSFALSAAGESQVASPITISLTGINGTVTVDPIVLNYDSSTSSTTLTAVPFGQYNVKYQGACRATTSVNITIDCAGIDAQTGNYQITQTIGAQGSGLGLVSTDSPTICPTLGSATTITATAEDFNSVATYAWQTRRVTATTPDPVWKTIGTTSTTTTVAAGTMYADYATPVLAITQTTAIKAGTQYRVIVTGTNNCGNAASVTSEPVSISFYNPAISFDATSGGNTTVCNNSFVNLSYTGALGTIVKEEWSTDKINWSTANIEWSTFFGVDYMGVDYATAKKYYFRAQVTDANCGITTTTAIKTITVYPSAVAGTASVAGTTATDVKVCNVNSGEKKYTVRLSGYVGKIQWKWRYATDEPWMNNDVPSGTSLLPATVDGFSCFSTGKTGSLVINNITKDVIFFASVITGPYCGDARSNEISFTGVSAVATQITADADYICPANGVNLTVGEGYVGNIQWMKSTDGINFINWGSAKGAASKATGILSKTTYYKAVFNVGGTCEVASSDVYTVHVIPYAKKSAITANVTTPAGTSSTAMCTTDASKVLTLAPGYVGSIQWETVVSTTAPTTETIWTPITDETADSYTVSNPSVGRNWFRVKFTSTCSTLPVYSSPVSVYYKDCSANRMVEIPIEERATSSFTVVGYPNPYSEIFNLSLSTTSNMNVGLTVYDMTGKLIEQKEFAPIEASELKIGNHYASGIYNLIITQGAEAKTIRMVKK